MTTQPGREENLMAVLDRIASEVAIGNVGYLTNLLVNLELNLVEQANQREEGPRIFNKQFDEYGVLVGFNLTPPYESEKEKYSVRTEFLREEYDSFLDQIARDYGPLSMMLTVNQIESQLNSAFEMLNTAETPILPIMKQCDGRGFPTAYRLNSEIIVVK